jgi:Ca2+-binding RTX toxin-like protein
MTNARTSNRLIRIAAAGLAGAAALVAPLAATAGASFEPVPSFNLQVQPGTVTSVNGIMTVDAATNSSSNIWIGDQVTASNTFTIIRDNAAPLHPGIGCLAVPEYPGLIRCMPAKHVVVRAGNFNDSVNMGGSWISSDVDGGSGDDTINTDRSVDYINGGTGKDVINAGAGSDVLNGGNDADYDRLTGGAGTDDCHAGHYYAECENVLNTRDIPR